MRRWFRRGNRRKKVLVIGWDGAPPELVFDRFAADMPVLQTLRAGAIYGPLRSTLPPITCPAWMAMMTGKTPGQLGFYGFRTRRDHSYAGMDIATSRLVREDTVWDILSRAGRRSLLVGIPQTYPPKPVNGVMVTSFLTPGTDSQYTYPPEFRDEIERVVPGYMLDVDNYRTDDKAALLDGIRRMTRKRFDLAAHLVSTREWDFCMVVEMGPDRMHHGFWRHFDPAHRGYLPGPYGEVMREYYAFLDACTGELIARAGDDTTVIIVSDHGATRMDGGVCINEWLIREGYLVLKEPPAAPGPLAPEMVDWSRTRAWGEGGYYARIMLNVHGREPEGTVAPADYDVLRDELVTGLESLQIPGESLAGTRVYRPEDLYPVCRGIPPDLMAFFGDLHWRSIGSVGTGALHAVGNDTGPDDANHSRHGIFLLREPGGETSCRLDDLDILDCAPTMLDRLGMTPPEDMSGRIIGRE